MSKEILCPRSSDLKIKLKGACPLKSCYFYSSKLSYNCCLIHQQIFFSNSDYLPPKVLEISTGLSSINYNKLVTLSLYIIRASIILKNYYTKNNIRDIHIKNKTFEICPFCFNVIDEDSTQCTCVDNRLLRRSRVKFNNNWKKSIKKNEKILQFFSD